MSDSELKISNLRNNYIELENDVAEAIKTNKELKATINYMETHPIQETEGIQLFNTEKGCFSRST